MPNIYQLSEPQLVAFVLILIRLSAFIFSMPIIGAQNVPSSLKILFSLLLALIVYPVALAKQSTVLNFSDEIVFLVFKEVAIGLMLGFMARLFFLAIAVAGQVISMSVGLQAGQILNPTLDTQSTVVEQFLTLLATMIFLLINGHHLLIIGICDSFQVLPLSFDGLKLESVKSVAYLGKDILTIGIKICAPVLISIFLTNLSMGIIGRAVPQVNVLVTSLHITILVGMTVLFFTVPLFVGEMEELKNIMAGQMFALMKHL
jgi:flagellar biosynthetic protein FliR